MKEQSCSGRSYALIARHLSVERPSFHTRGDSMKSRKFSLIAAGIALTMTMAACAGEGAGSSDGSGNGDGSGGAENTDGGGGVETSDRTVGGARETQARLRWHVGGSYMSTTTE